MGHFARLYVAGTSAWPQTPHLAAPAPGDRCCLGAPNGRSSQAWLRRDFLLVWSSSVQKSGGGHPTFSARPASAASPHGPLFSYTSWLAAAGYVDTAQHREKVLSYRDIPERYEYRFRRAHFGGWGDMLVRDPNPLPANSPY